MRLLCIIGHEIAENQFGTVPADFLCLFMPFFFVLFTSLSPNLYLLIYLWTKHKLIISIYHWKLFLFLSAFLYVFETVHSTTASSMREHTFHVSGQKKNFSMTSFFSFCVLKWALRMDRRWWKLKERFIPIEMNDSPQGIGIR